MLNTEAQLDTVSEDQNPIRKLVINLLPAIILSCFLAPNTRMPPSWQRRTSLESAEVAWEAATARNFCNIALILFGLVTEH